MKLQTKQDLLNKATKYFLFNKKVAKLMDKKTMIRRICKVQPRKKHCNDLYPDMYNKDPLQWAYWCKDGRLHDCLEKPPYKVGDIVWAREPASVESYKINKEHTIMEVKYLSDEYKCTMDIPNRL